MTEDVARGSAADDGGAFSISDDESLGAPNPTEAQVAQAQGSAGTEAPAPGPAQVQLAQATGSGLTEVVVNEPAAGEVANYTAEPGTRYVITFDPQLAVVSVVGEDLILTFADGGRIVFHGLGLVDNAPNAPFFEIAGTDFPSGALFAQAQAASGPQAAPETLEAAAGPEGPQGTGATHYDDNLGNLIALLNPQGVIPPVELAFHVPELEPTPVLLPTEGGPTPAVGHRLSATGTGATVDEDDIRFTESSQLPGSDTQDLGAPFDPTSPTGGDGTIVTGTITAGPGFGQPGTVALTTQGLAALGLTSSTNDLPLQYDLSTDGLTLTATAGGETVFVLNIDPLAGSDTTTYTFELVGSLNHPTGGGENGLPIPFQVAVTDANGDTGTGSFTVTVVDDVPTIDFLQGYDEGENGSYNGDLSVQEAQIPDTAVTFPTIVYGADGPETSAPALTLALTGVQALDESGTEGGDQALPGLTSGGQPVVVANSGPGTVVGFIDNDGSGNFSAGDVKIFEAQISSADATDPRGATFTFELYGPVDHPDAGQTGTEDQIKLGFRATVIDDDGDTGSLDLSVTIDDGGPSVAPEQVAFTVDEDGLPGGIAGGNGDVVVPNTDGDGNEATAAGALLYSFGPDGPGDVDFAALDGQNATAYSSSLQGTIALKSMGDQVTYVWDGETHTLSGVANAGTEGARTVFTLQITDIATGAYTFTLLDNVDHPDPTTEDNLQLQLPFTVTDFDGDTATAQALVTINDDQPAPLGPTLTHDETPGIDNPDDVDPATIPAALVAALADPALFDGATPAGLGAAMKSFAVAFGADGPGSVALDAVVDGTDSGLNAAASGQDILLFNGPDGTVVGRVGSAGGAVAFVVFLDGSNVAAGGNADLWFTQYVGVQHDNPADPDEANPEPSYTGTDANGRPVVVQFADEFFTVSYTATDADGDSAKATATITIEDDGPTILTREGGFVLVHDESAGEQNGLPATATEDNNDNDVAPAAVEPQVQDVEAWVSLLQGTAVDLTAIGGVQQTLQQGVDFDAGADGLKEIRFDTATISTGTASGLSASADGSAITYVVVDGELILGVTGYAGSDANGRPVFDRVAFSLHLDGTGNTTFTFVQYEAVVHPVAGDGSNGTHDEGLAAGAADARLSIGYVVEDNDGDTATASGAGAIVVDIEDDGPVAHNDTDMVPEGTFHPTHGNVITGIDPDANPDFRGTLQADSGGADGVNVIRSITHDGLTYTLNAAGTNIVVTDANTGLPAPGSFFFNSVTGELIIPTGLGGQFLIDLKGAGVGDYTYQAPATVNNSPSDPSEAFVYKIEDRDGDTAAATLTITVKDAHVPTAEHDAVVHDETAGLQGSDIVPDPTLVGAAEAASGQTLVAIGAAQTTPSFDPGGDGLGGITFDTSPSGIETGDATGLARSADDKAITYVVADDNLILGVVDYVDGSNYGDVVFSLHIDATSGLFTFVQYQAVEHPLAGDGSGGSYDELLAAPLSVGYVVTDGDGSTATSTIAVDIRDDGPSAVDDPTAMAQQDGPAIGGDVVANDDLGSDGPALGGPVVSFSYLGDDGSGDPTTLSALAGSTVTTFLGGTLTVGADGTWTYDPPSSISQTTLAKLSLQPGDPPSDDFSYVAQDADGDTATAVQPIELEANHLLGLSFVTNTQQDVQYFLFTFDIADDGKEFFTVLRLDEQGQEGNFLLNVGYAIDPSLQYESTVQYLAATDRHDGTAGGVNQNAQITTFLIDLNPFVDDPSRPTDSKTGTEGINILNASDGSGPGLGTLAQTGNIAIGTNGSSSGSIDFRVDGDTPDNPSTNFDDGAYAYHESGFGSGSMIGGVLTGGAGPDLLAGAAQMDGAGGNDILLLDGSTTSAAGGAGIDLLRIDPVNAAGSHVLDLDTSDGNGFHFDGNALTVTGVEIIDLSGADAGKGQNVVPGDNQLSLSSTDVLSLSDFDTVFVLGGGNPSDPNSGDVLRLNGTNWTAVDGNPATPQVDPSSNGFQEFASTDGATVFVDPNISVFLNGSTTVFDPHSGTIA